MNVLRLQQQQREQHHHPHRHDLWVEIEETSTRVAPNKTDHTTPPLNSSSAKDR